MAFSMVIGSTLNAGRPAGMTGVLFVVCKKITGEGG